MGLMKWYDETWHLFELYLLVDKSTKSDQDQSWLQILPKLAKLPWFLPIFVDKLVNISSSSLQPIFFICWSFKFSYLDLARQIIKIFKWSPYQPQPQINPLKCETSVRISNSIISECAKTRSTWFITSRCLTVANLAETMYTVLGYHHFIYW